jgi:hypothetical protein
LEYFAGVKLVSHIERRTGQVFDNRVLRRLFRPKLEEIMED